MADPSQALAIQSGDIDNSVTPGTVHLIDVDHTLHTKHSRAHADIVLVPTPSEDPDDPLNWGPRRKLLSLVCMCLYVWFTGVCNSVVYSVLVPLSEANDLSVADLNAGTGYLVSSSQPCPQSNRQTDRIVPPLRLGSFVLATIRPAVRQTSHVSHFHRRDCRSHSLGAIR